MSINVQQARNHGSRTSASRTCFGVGRTLLASLGFALLGSPVAAADLTIALAAEVSSIAPCARKAGGDHD